MGVPIQRFDQSSSDRDSSGRRFMQQCSGSFHPVTSDRLRFTSDLPPDMKELIDETAHSDR
jgi:hypothetical protein